MVTADVELRVKMAPQIVHDESPVKGVVAGGPIEISCDATGYPTPSISWYLETLFLAKPRKKF